MQLTELVTNLEKEVKAIKQEFLTLSSQVASLKAQKQLISQEMERMSLAHQKVRNELQEALTEQKSQRELVASELADARKESLEDEQYREAIIKRKEEQLQKSLEVAEQSIREREFILAEREESYIASVAAVNTNQELLVKLENDLNQRDIILRNKEKDTALVHRRQELDLAKRLEDLTDRSKELDRLEKDLAKRKESFASKERDLSIHDQQVTLKLQEAENTAKKLQDALDRYDRRSKALDAREKALTSREIKLADRESVYNTHLTT